MDQQSVKLRDLNPDTSSLVVVSHPIKNLSSTLTSIMSCLRVTTRSEKAKKKQFYSDDNVRASFFTVLCAAEYLLLLVMFAPCDLETVCIYQ